MRRAVRIALWWTLLVGLLVILPARADEPLAQSRQLLEWCGALALLEQAQPVAQLVLAREAPQRQRELLPRFDAAPLQQKLIEKVAAQLPAESLQQALATLQQPLAKRVRFFERALTQPNVAQEWQRWREQNPAPTEARLQLLRAIDSAAHDSRLTAQLQSAVEASLRRQLGLAALTPTGDVVSERERHLQIFTEQYLLYAYRYLRDDELQEYATLLQDAMLQQLFEGIERELVAVIADTAG